MAPEGPRTGYKRELFPLWIDADHDGCNTREEVLIAESRSRAQVDPYGCKVVAGDWYSLYDGLTFTDPAELDIDHMVPLAEAWDSGASSWDTARRQAYANDLDHPQALRAVSAAANRSKGDLDPGQRVRQRLGDGEEGVEPERRPERGRRPPGDVPHL